MQQYAAIHACLGPCYPTARNGNILQSHVQALLCGVKHHIKALSSSEAARRRTLIVDLKYKHMRPHAKSRLQQESCECRSHFNLQRTCAAQARSICTRSTATKDSHRGNRDPHAYAAFCSTMHSLQPRTCIQARSHSQPQPHTTTYSSMCSKNKDAMVMPRLHTPTTISTAHTWLQRVWQEPTGPTNESPGLERTSSSLSGARAVNGLCGTLIDQGPSRTTPPLSQVMLLSQFPAVSALAPEPYHSSWMRSSRSLSVIGAADFSLAAP